MKVRALGGRMGWGGQASYPVLCLPLRRQNLSPPGTPVRSALVRCTAAGNTRTQTLTHA